MLWTLTVVLLVFWLVGMLTSHTFGGALHVLLLGALAVVIIRLFRGRKLST